MQKTFLNSLNNFRALAIIFIVAGHCYVIAGLEMDTVWEKALASFTTDGTSFFVFISGFLFHHIFYKNFQYKKFIKNKVKNVFVPYTLLGLPVITLYVVFHKMTWSNFFPAEGAGLLNEYITPFLMNYITGSFLTAYWYIPFIMLMFMLAPLHAYFVRMTVKKQTILTVSLLIVALFLHRPKDNIFIPQALLYFMPVYLIGIMASLYRDVVYRVFHKKEWMLFLSGCLFIFLQLAFGNRMSFWDATQFEWNLVDFVLLQKLSFCFFWMVFLHRFEEVSLRSINIVAETSFAIFFLHPILLKIIQELIIPKFGTVDESWLVWAGSTAFFVMLSLFIAKTTKFLLPKYSRYLIGY